MKLTRYEQETVINYNEEESTASIYTHNRALRRKLEKLSADRPEDCRLYRISRDGLAVEYCLPKSWVRINPPRKGTPLTEEQKQERLERLTNARKS